MTDTDPAEEATLFPKTAGERLREAREAQGLSLAEIAARTRVPVRQLEAIEASNFSALPSITYSVGFAKAYARTVGVDEVAIAREIRGTSSQATQRTDYEAYEVSDPSRVPTRGIAIGSLLVAVLLIVAAGLWYGTTWFRGSESAAPAPVTDEPLPAPTPAPVAAPVATGQVTLVATDEVWLKIYDATGKTLFQNTLKTGERYDVPLDANNPMINVGRPDKLQVLVNGSAVPALGDGKVAIKDRGVSAAALMARGMPAAAPTPVPGATAPSAPAAAPVSAPKRTVQQQRPRPSAPAASAPLNIAAPVSVPVEPAPAPAPTAAP